MVVNGRVVVKTHYFLYEDIDAAYAARIQFQKKVNRMWTRYLMKRNEESTVTALTARGRTRVVIVPSAEAQNKKKLKMRLLLHLFMKKPVMRDTILFHLLRD